MTTLAATVILAGGAVATAPAATAVGSSKCNWDYSNVQFDVLKKAALRTGPGTKYSAKGTLSKGTKFYYLCEYTKGHTSWIYGKVQSGTHKNAKGWAYGKKIGLLK
ncbi:SH3 domain-containing protein [Streptomyces niger]|uniref:SH3 domain-containing protein n=1 Tax=Streptomyces niger TaxID=66373 RepID=UPI0006997283|nr:SH3 domain-containing protein [Streptomyces niger]